MAGNNLFKECALTTQTTKAAPVHRCVLRSAAVAKIMELRRRPFTYWLFLPEVLNVNARRRCVSSAGVM